MFHGDLDVDTANGLKELRRRIAKANIPSSKLDETINIATWNIREFGKRPRRKASLHFIAEILNEFDLIAIVELRRNLAELPEVMGILGPYWRVVFSDFTTDEGGNDERFAYLYDKRAVTFTGLAAEADAPRIKNQETGEYETAFSWWRKPFIASFRSGNFDFVAVSAHIRWGKRTSDRIAPLTLLAEWIETRRQDSFGTDKDLILLGDFNITSRRSATYKAITSQGLQMPAALAQSEFGSNLAKDKRYDQILHYPNETSNFTNNGGMLDFYTGGIKKLYPTDTPKKTAFTYELSDHLPLWIQLNVDTETEKLDQILNPK